LAVGWRWLRVTLPALSRQVTATPYEGALVVGIGYSLLLGLTWALAPEVQFDALNYQLAVPRMYLSEGRVVDLHYLHSYLARLMSMVFALGLALEGPAVAKLLTLSIGIGVVLALHALGSRAFGRAAGAWAAALFSSTPLVVWLTSTTYVDLAATMFTVTSFLALLCWRESRIPGWVCAGGALLGAAIGTKLTTVLLVPGFALVLLAWCVRDVRPAGRRTLGALLGFGAASLVAVAAPWYAITYVFTGNPVFPLLNGVFRSPRWPPVNSVRSLGEFGVGSSPEEILKLPFLLTSQTQLFGEPVAGSMGPTLTLLPLAAFLLVARRPAVRGLAGIAGASWLAWAYGYQYARYFVPALPFVIVLVVGTVLHCSPPGWMRRGNLALLGLIVVAQLTIGPLLFWNIPERFPIALAFGREAPDAFLARALPTYPAARFVNHHIRPGEKVVGVRCQNLRFYLDAPLLAGWSADLADVIGASAGGEAGRMLAERGYRYIIVDGRHARAPHDFPDQAFLDCCATIAFARPPGRVYRIHPPLEPGAARPEENLLRNPGLEESTGEGAVSGWHPYGRPGIQGDPTLARSGLVAVAASADSGLTQPVPIEAGRLYTLSHYSRADEPGQFARLQINWLDARGGLVEASIDVVPVGKRWAKSEMTVTAPERAVTAMVYASVHERSRVVFDDFSLVSHQ
jgi:hypothetical protein